MVAELFEPDKADAPSGWTFTPRIVGTVLDQPAPRERSEVEQLLDALGVTGRIRRMSKMGEKGLKNHATELRDRAVAHLTHAATAGANTWFSTSVFDSSGSGTVEHVEGVNALTFDLDDAKIRGGRAGAWLLVKAISNTLGVQPRAVVDSGHGLQVHYAIDDVAAHWEAGDDVARHRATRAIKRAHKAVRHLAAADGANLDTTDGPERLWRMPGSTNSKPDQVPVAATLVSTDPDAESLTLAEVEAAADRVLGEEPEVVAPSRPTNGPTVGGTTLERWAAAAVEGELMALRATHDWPEHHKDNRGINPRTGEPFSRRGWEAVCFEAAVRLAELVKMPGSGLDVAQVRQAYIDAAPRGGYIDDSWLTSKWDAQWRRAQPAQPPADTAAAATTDFMITYPASTTATPTEELTAVDEINDNTLPTPTPGSESELAEAHLVDRVHRDVLDGRFCWSAGLGWLRWDRRRWEPCTEAMPLEAVRRYFIRWHAQEAMAGADRRRLIDLGHLLSRARITAVVALARGVVQVDAAAFDGHHHLLNVNNGVVDLRDGSLRPHDPALLLTKVTRINYIADAEHADWTTALTALESEVADWMQVRLGQAATGETPSDDVMPVCQGGGENGKTAFLGACTAALGEHAVMVSDRVLLASPDAHPTELMELRGARLAVIEETPEARRLSVARLKKVVGTPTITARLIRQDSVSFTATHSLLITSNYRPVVEETDHGTWRRLALVPWPHRFRAPGQPLAKPGDRLGDPGLRQRLRNDPAVATAVLAWLVQGAVRYYAADGTMPAPPAAVVAATRAWRTEADLVLGFLDDQLEPASENHVASSEMLAAFNGWLTERGHHTWTDRTFASRFGDHADVAAAGITQGRARLGVTTSRQGGRWPAKLPDRFRAWLGVRFRTEGAESGADQDEQPSGTAGTARPDERWTA